MKKCIVFWGVWSLFDQTDFHFLFTEESKQIPLSPYSKLFRPTARWERRKIVSGVVLCLLYSPLIPMTTLM